MQLRRHADAASFLASASDLLLAEEARHNLLFGLCATLMESPGAYPDFRLWTAEEPGRCIAAALMTPPHNLVLARPATPDALDFLVQQLHQEGVELPGVTGAVPESEQFADAWAQRSGSRIHVRMRQAIYQVAAPRPPGGVTGEMRRADVEDRPLLTEWVRAFESEALPEGAVVARPEEILDRRLESARGGIAVWEDGQPVSMAGFGGPTPHGIRIGPVYTPPELRRRGYARALVAALSAELLAEGRDYCFLYTDLANPTSNRVYTAVGYERVCESVEFVFAEKGRSNSRRSASA